MMSNLFYQVQGRRIWTLISPRFSQYMRPTHGFGYIIASIYTSWTQGTYQSHLSKIPKVATETRPGDLLYIPPWWCAFEGVLIGCE